MKILKDLGIVILILFFPFHSYCALFKLDSGEVIQGTLKELKTEYSLIGTPYGQIKVPNKQIKTMDFTGETFNYQIVLEDKSQVNGNLMLLEDENFIVNTNAGIITISKNKILFLRETEYSKQIAKEEKMKKEAKELEQLKAKSDRLNQVRFLAGYGLLQGDFADVYKSGLTLTLAFDRIFFLEQFKNLRLGVLIGYQKNNATNVENVSLEFLTYMIYGRYMFQIAEEGFFSNIKPYLILGGGSSQIKLTKADSTSESGLNSSIIGGVGTDIFLNYRIDIILEGHYKRVFGESERSISEIELLAGASYKF